MVEWTRQAKCAVNLCEEWATEVAPQLHCQLFLYGSTIHKGGERFDGEKSDLDIIVLFSEILDSLARLKALRRLLKHKQSLELRMLPALRRKTCNEPGVSIVAITDIELQSNLLQKGSRNYFDNNFFYDLNQRQQRIGIASDGTRVMRGNGHQVLVYARNMRSRFLSICANGTGGLADHCGADPIPKALLRTAAQLIDDDIIDGEGYDTRRGLELIHEMLLEKYTEAPEFRDLFDKVSVRRSGRGKLACLSGEDQILLSEMIFDKAVRESTEEVATWEICADSKNPTHLHTKELFSAIQRIIPNARLIGFRQDSSTLEIRSLLTEFELLEELYDVQVLARLLRVDEGVLSARLHEIVMTCG